MKLVICQDSKVYTEDNLNYYKVSMGSDYYKRYLVIAENITLCMRVKPLSSCKIPPQYSMNFPELNIVACPDIMSVKGRIRNSKKLKQVLEKEIKNSDFVLLMLPGFIGNIGFQLAKKYHKPILVDVGGCAWDSLWNHSFKGKIMAPYQFIKTRQCVKNADYVLYVTQHFLQKRYPTNGCQVACSDVILNFDKDSIWSSRQQHIEKKGAKIIIGTIGSTDLRYKGHIIALKALAKLYLDGNVEWEYQMVGAGSGELLIPFIKKYHLEKNVRFMGTMLHDNILSWLDNIDVYIQPSLTEGLPRALLEAMSRGLLCIGSNAGGIPELLNPKYIFNRNLPWRDKNLYCILSSITKEQLLSEGLSNIITASSYNETTLNQKRNAFWREYKEYGCKKSPMLLQ